MARLCELCRSHGFPTEVTDDVTDLKDRFDRNLVAGPVLIVAAGGDGTLALAASIASTVGAAILPLPLGTENLLARHFGHSQDAARAMAAIGEGSVEAIDSMMLAPRSATAALSPGDSEARRSLIMATVGFDADVVRRMQAMRGGHIRRSSYVRPIGNSLCKYRFPKLRVRLDDREPLECRWLMVFNLPRYAASLAIEPDADPRDGMLDVVAFDRGSILSGLKYWLGVLSRTHHRLPDVHRFRAKTIQVESLSGRPPLQSDGDYVGKIPVTISSQPGSVRLLMPSATMGA